MGREMGRLRLSLIFTLFLYAGPVLAGWSGAGWADWPIFALVFVLWSLLMRPGQWRGGAGVPFNLALMAVLALAALALGWGLALVVDSPALPKWLPYAVALVGAGVPRLLSNPAQAGELDDLLTNAIDQIRASTPDDAPLGPEDQAELDRLLALPDASPDAAAALAAAVARPDPYDLLLALSAALDVKNPPRRALRRALIEWETDAARLGKRPHPLPRNAFDLAGQDVDLIALYLDRAAPLLAANPVMWSDYPDPSDLAAANHGLPPELARRLQDHIDAIEQAAGL